jgi:serine/threonine-protein kinase
MATTDLGACEWFVWDLRRSNLIDRGQLDQVVGEFLKKHPRAEPPQLADYLVNQQILTQFQSDRILQGKTQGLVLGPYTLMDSIGAGSMGTVYKAFSKQDNKWYAVKVLPRRSMWNVRLARRQVRSFEQFNHATIVPFVDVGTSGGLHYLAWPLVDGDSMETVLEREKKMAPDVSAYYALQIATGMSVCHQHGIYHGLLKPSNLMLSADGQVHILDFGIGALLAENEGESLVDTMSTANTLTSGLDCASPESIMEPTTRTAAGDQYSLGCCLYYFLTGRYPFPEGSAVEKMMAHQYKQPTPIKDLVPNVSHDLEEVVERLMQKTPEARYSSSEEVVEALRPLACARPPKLVQSSAKPGKGPGAGAKAVDNGAAAGKTATSKGGTAVKPTAGSGQGTLKNKGSAQGLGKMTRSLRENLQGGGGAAPPKKELPPEDEDALDEDHAEDEEEEEEEDEDDEEYEEGEASPLVKFLSLLVVVCVCGAAFWVAWTYLIK